MPNDYIKEADEKIMRHSKWAEHSNKYEINLAKTLHNDPAVLETAQKALRRMSTVLNGYYGKGEKEKKPPLPEPVPEMEKFVEGLENELGQQTGTEAPKTETETSPKEETDSGTTGNTEETPIEVTDTLMNAFLKDAPESSGQVGKSEDTLENQTNLNEIMNEDGNLREKMTAMFNATIYNSRGKNAKTIKQIGENATKEQAEQLGLNMGEIEQDRRFSSDIMDVTNISIKGAWYNPKRLLSYFLGDNARKKITKDKTKALGKDFYEKNQMGLSKREKKFSMQEGENLKWLEGVGYNKVDETSYWVKSRRSRGFRLVTGPSGTTTRMLRAYKWLGASNEELLKFRLALMGWMLSGDHSLYEIVTGAKQAGVRGNKEDTTNAITLYQTIDPLEYGYLRGKVAEKRQFPHEHVYRDILNENEDKVRQVQVTLGKESLTLNHKNKKMTAAQHATAIYTSNLYQLMNPGVSKGSSSEKSVLKASQKGDPKKAFSNEQSDVAKVSSSVLLKSMPYMKKEKGKTVYRATSVAAFNSKYGKDGNTVTMKNFTSTSKNLGVANNFYKEPKGAKAKFVKPVIMAIELDGHGGVDIQNMSVISTEAEILLMTGTKLQVTKGLYTTTKGKNMVKLKEVGNPNNKYTGDDNSEMSDPVTSAPDDYIVSQDSVDDLQEEETEQTGDDSDVQELTVSYEPPELADLKKRLLSIDLHMFKPDGAEEAPEDYINALLYVVKYNLGKSLQGLFDFDDYLLTTVFQQFTNNKEFNNWLETAFAEKKKPW